MKIQIDGAGTKNKGAKLMLRAVLEQIEERHPEAQIIYNSVGKIKTIKTPLKIKQPLFEKLGPLPGEVLNELDIHIPPLSELTPHKDVDLLLDASGFRFGDQWKHSKKYLKWMERYYRKMKDRGTKIVFLPQAFGPFETPQGKRTADILDHYADLIFARESKSKEYLLKAGVSPEEIEQYPDFTILTKGEFPEKYRDLRGAVCIIPNNKMIRYTKLHDSEYLNLLDTLIKDLQGTGKEVFLLNHEGKKDLEICQRINERHGGVLPIVSDLNAKEIKGLIGESYLVVSSRYHGVVSALNQGVPCLATSWSHKYELLFRDYGIEACLIDVRKDYRSERKKIGMLLDPARYKEIRDKLFTKRKVVREKSEEMWEKVWKVAEN
jgi:colanic acid/amylovoran biosynthesis protein